jgi:hypothetical protein
MEEEVPEDFNIECQEISIIDPDIKKLPHIKDLAYKGVPFPDLPEQ